jgi:hypothetical protein
MAEKKPSPGKQALEAAVTAVPYVGQIYKGAKIAKKFALPVTMALFMLFIGPCAGPQGEREQPIEPAEQVAAVAPNDVITAAKKAAAATGSLDEEGVPWTLILALAMKASNGGRFSPFDQCDRIPDGDPALARAGYSSKTGAEGTCSAEPSVQDTVTPAIGGEADPALGPYLLRRGVIPEDVDPQMIKATIKSLESDPESATDFVALRLHELRVELTNEGYSFDQENPDTAAASWAQAVRRLGVMDPFDASGCLVPFFALNSASATAQKEAAKVVDTTWRCELSKAPLHTFASSSLTSDPAVVPVGNAVSLVIREALTVAWAYSQWGTVLPGCTTDAEGVTTVSAADETPAGFFPLTKAVFDEFNTIDGANRCDKSANVVAAAKAFAAGETIEPGKKRDSGVIGDRTDELGPWNKALGGWSAMPWALGADYGKIPTFGPLSVESTKFTPSEQCSTDVTAWVETAANSLPPTAFAPELGTMTPADSALVATYVAVNPLPTTCQVQINAQQVFNQFVGSKASASGHALWTASTPTTIPDTTTTLATTAPTLPAAPAPFTADQQRASKLLAIAQWFFQRQGSTVAATPPAPVPGYNSLVPRLSLTGAELPACTAAPTTACLPALPTAAPDAFALGVVTVARAAGGIVENDPSVSGDLIELLSQPKFGSLATTACMPSAVAKAIDVAMQKYPQVMLQATSDEADRVRQSKTVIPVELILEQFATESSFGIGVVDEFGGTGAVMAAAGAVADTGVDRDGNPNQARSRTKGVIGSRGGSEIFNDHDDGRIDGMTAEDRAIGLLQFMPATWLGYTRLFPGLLLDANNDGVADPHNAYDQTLAAVLFYARNGQGRNLATDQQARAEVISGYSGFRLNTPSFTKYMKVRADKVRPVLACLQAEGAVSSVPAVVLAPDGCPTSVPQNTMRDGSVNQDIHALCLSAVAKAPTIEAKKALLFLFRNLGVPYSQSLRQADGWFDCSSYAMRAYRAAGIETYQDGFAPNSYLLGPAAGYTSYPWLRDVSRASALPGDILVRIPPDGHHVMVLLDGGWIIHTGGPEGDPTHISKLPQDFNKLKVRRVLPDKAPKTAAATPATTVPA